MDNPIAQGLQITLVGLVLVFAALVLLWAMILLLTRIFSVRSAASSTAEIHEAAATAQDEAARAEAMAAVALTAERAQVAALVAGALMGNAIPLLMDVPPDQCYEDGRTSPSWVTAKRAVALRGWQPARRPEG